MLMRCLPLLTMIALGCEGSTSIYVFDDGFTEGTGSTNTDDGSNAGATEDETTVQTIDDWASFIDAAGEAVCEYYWDCEYEGIYNDDEDVCHADVESAYFDTITATGCTYDQELAESCLNYIGNLACDQILDFREQENVCAIICG
jgi:hypothetical protein